MSINQELDNLPDTSQYRFAEIAGEHVGRLIVPRLVVAGDLSANAVERWQHQFVEPGSSTLQSVWRRHQFEWNKDLSGWQPGDARRKVLHYKDVYMLENGNQGNELVVDKPYLWLSVASPKDEVLKYETRAREALIDGGWSSVQDKDESHGFERDGLNFEYVIRDEQPEDVCAGRTFPADYLHFEATFRGQNVELSDSERFLPWGVVNAAYRPIDERHEPRTLESLKEIKDFLPAQVELGCGPSVEAGVPALHYLHGLYRIQDPEGKFIFGPDRDDLLTELLTQTEQFYQKAGLIYERSLRADLTPFYRLLKKLHEDGSVVGSIITNGIDELCGVAGLPEQNVRSYERKKLVPSINFDENAKSLLVIGSHADRRLVRRAARQAGLQVIYIDPEGYHEDGKFYPHPMEAPQSEDIHIKMTAQEFTDAW